MRKAVWGENLKHGFVRGLGWNALAYSTSLLIPQLQQYSNVTDKYITTLRNKQTGNQHKKSISFWEVGKAHSQYTVTFTDLKK